MYIAFYISSHGFGHMTRCLALIEGVLNNTDHKIYIASGEKQNDFAKVYLKNFSSRVIYNDITTDIGFINKKNSLEVDIVLLENKLKDFISEWDSIVNKEIEMLKKLNIKKIVCDISPIAALVAKKLNLQLMFISNFSWVEQYEHIGLDKNIINKFKEAYMYVDKFIKYDLCLPINDFDTKETFEVGFCCRKISKNRVGEIKKEHGKSIFITCGKSANLSSIEIKNFKGTIFITKGIEIKGDNCNVVELPVDILDTQNYIAASEFIITKAGWGTIAEAIIGKTPLVLIERESAREDSFNIQEIKRRNLGISINEKYLNCIDIECLNSEINKNINYLALDLYKNDIEKIVRIICF